MLFSGGTRQASSARAIRQVGPHSPQRQKAHPISERPSEDQVLSRCVSGKTQNANGCLHSLIWTRFAKNRFASRQRVHSAHVNGARQFNSGASATQERGCLFLFACLLLLFFVVFVCFLFVFCCCFFFFGGGGGL